MALSFPPNLDDGELWLPKEIIADVLEEGHHRHGAVSLSRRRHVEVLANQLAALGLLGSAAACPGNRNQPAFRPLFHEGFRVVTGLEAAAAAVRGFRVPACRSFTGTGAFLPGSDSVSRTVMAQVVERRERILPRRQTLSQSMPARVNGSGRESGGTGVFLPRVSYYYDANARKKLKNVTVGLLQQEQKVMMASPVHQCQAPPELTLPQDWTY